MSVKRNFGPAKIVFTDAEGTKRTVYGWARVFTNHKKKSVGGNFFRAVYTAWVTEKQDMKAKRAAIEEIKVGGWATPGDKIPVVKKKSSFCRAISYRKDGDGRAVLFPKRIEIRWEFVVQGVRLVFKEKQIPTGT